MTESTTLEGQGTSAAAPDRPTRKRGVGFPVVGLPEAVSILRKAGQYGTDHKLGAFAGYMGHSTANSGSFKRRIAAFKDWRFIAGGTGDRVVFTDLGRRVAYPTDPAKEKQDLQEAFRNCDIFWKVYDESAKGVAYSLETLANLAVRQLGVAPISKDRFAESLAKSAVAAGFGEMDGRRISFVGPGGNAVQDREATEDQGGNEGIYMPTGHISSSAVAPGRNAHAVTVDGDEGGDERPESDLASTHKDAFRRSTSMVEAAHAPSARHSVPRQTTVFGTTEAGAVVDDTRDEGLLRIRAGRNTNVLKGDPTQEKPAVLHQQSWDFQSGNLVFEIKSSRSLPASAFMQIGKVMAEIEKLKELLTEASSGVSEGRGTRDKSLSE